LNVSAIDIEISEDFPQYGSSDEVIAAVEYKLGAERRDRDTRKEQRAKGFGLRKGE
jgi:hypothetical protein